MGPIKRQIMALVLGACLSGFAARAMVLFVGVVGVSTGSGVLVAHDDKDMVLIAMIALRVKREREGFITARTAAHRVESILIDFFS